jgi:hypothetical protein
VKASMALHLYIFYPITTFLTFRANLKVTKYFLSS